MTKRKIDESDSAQSVDSDGAGVSKRKRDDPPQTFSEEDEAVWQEIMDEPVDEGFDAGVCSEDDVDVDTDADVNDDDNESEEEALPVKKKVGMSKRRKTSSAPTVQQNLEPHVDLRATLDNGDTPQLLECGLDEFDMTQIDHASSVCLLGRTGIGKSFLLRDIMFHKRDIEDGIFFSPTSDFNDDFNGVIPPLFMYDDYDPIILKRFIIRQKRLNKYRYKEGLPKKYSFCIIDDCGCDSVFTHDPTLRQVFMRGRHIGIFFIFCIQYAKSVPPSLRTQLSYIFLFNEPDVKQNKAVHEGYCGKFEKFSDFRKVFLRLTTNFRTMVVKFAKNAAALPLEQSYFWYKAQKRDKYRVGAPYYWKFAEDQFDPHWDSEDEDEPDAEKAGVRKSSTTNAAAAAGRNSKKRKASAISADAGKMQLVLYKKQRKD